MKKSKEVIEVPGKVWRWEVWPHPYDSAYDYYVTDDDNEARQAILYAAEMHLWDGNDGGERTLRVVMQSLPWRRTPLT